MSCLIPGDSKRSRYTVSLGPIEIFVFAPLLLAIALALLSPWLQILRAWLR
jgi:hypothetical protein